MLTLLAAGLCAACRSGGQPQTTATDSLPPKQDTVASAVSDSALALLLKPFLIDSIKKYYTGPAAGGAGRPMAANIIKEYQYFKTQPDTYRIQPNGWVYTQEGYLLIKRLAGAIDVNRVPLFERYYYDKLNRVVMEERVGYMGDLLPYDDGVAVMVNVYYDKTNNKHEVRMYNTRRQPTRQQGDGPHIARFDYDSKGRCTDEWYYGTDGLPLGDGLPFHRHYTFNEDMTEVSEKVYDKDNKLIYEQKLD